jgi:VanZ family protein
MDLASSRRSALSTAVGLFTALYWVALFVGTHLPLELDPIRTPRSLDKPQHVAAFALLAGLLCATGAQWGIRSWRLTGGVLGLVALYGVFDEWTQGFVQYREPELLDWVADIGGSLLGMAIFWLCWLVVASGRRRVQAARSPKT